MLSLTIWDVQHGSATYVRTPGGKHMVVDLGVGSTKNGTTSFSPLLHLRYNYGVQRLDEVLITHPHRDHLDDIFNFDLMNPGILRRPRHLTEQEIRAGNKPGDSAVLDKYFEIDRRYNSPIGPEDDPESPANNGGAAIMCFTPIKSSRSNLNNHSIVTFFTYANSTICLPGDNEGPSWRELLESPIFCALLSQTDILVAAHHGREAGYCDDIFQYCSPYLVLVSDGPLSDTSAIEKYRRKAKGWNVRSRSTNQYTERWVLTTRSDGVIVVECFSSGGQNYLEVSID